MDQAEGMESDVADLGRPDDAASSSSSSDSDDGDESGMPTWSWEGINNCALLDCSNHGDGSIYKATHFWHRFFHVADTRETLLEPMMLSAPTDCQPNTWACKAHLGTAMMQIFSLKLAHTSAAAIDDGQVELYGFLAVRDSLNPLRNYIFNRTREDPLVLRVGDNPGSVIPIPMAGPKRGIAMKTSVLVEFDMKIKRGGRREEEEEDDLQLIDGAAAFSELISVHCSPYTRRIQGEGGAVDICLTLLRNAVEATIQVGVSGISRASGFHLSLSCHVSRMPPKIELFQGVVAEPCDLKRFVVAVVRGSALVLYLKADHRISGSDHVPYCCAFRAKAHGYDVHEFKMDVATVLVKVSWSTLVPHRVARELL